MKKAFIFSIEEFSTFDGPGCRTSIFLKGCPLRCEWCHNPEGQEFANQIMKAQSGCLGCGACIKAGYEETGEYKLSTASISVCPNHLLRYCAKEYSTQELLTILEKNIPLLNRTGGGITFSGGEPLAQSDFLLEMLQLLKGKTNRAIQTSGFCKPDIFKVVLEETDYVLYDLKLMDDIEHQHFTGVSNKKILQNFHSLCVSGKEFVVRTPLIPGVTDREENLEAIAQALKREGVKTIDLLEYNKMAGGKYASVGKKYTPSFDEKIPSQIHREVFDAYDIYVNIL